MILSTSLLACSEFEARLISKCILAWIDHQRKFPSDLNHPTSKYGIARVGYSRIGLAMPACSWNHWSPMRNSVLKSWLRYRCV